MQAHTTITILTIAGRSHGICTTAALRAAGISRSAITRRVADGTLTLVRGGIYEAPLLVDEVTPLIRAVTAVPGSALSRQTAATIHRYAVPTSSWVHVTAPKGAGAALAGTTVHESRDLGPIDIVASHHGLPVTSPARTLFDLAAVLSARRLAHLVRTAATDDASAIDDLQRCFARLAQRGRPGVANLRAVLDDIDGGGRPFTESELEARVWAGFRQNGIVGFRPQFRPSWFDGRRGIVDFAHERAALIVEADGRRWHARHDSMVDDRRRDRTAAANGWIVVRVMWEDVVDRGEATFTELAGIVETRLAERAA
jgi:very-short-patch-repair endonuclease